MTFTDDDLKRLKDYLSSPGRPYWGPGLSGDTTEALLARLEAAEELEDYWKYYAPVSKADEKEYNAKVEAWKKKAGKNLAPSTTDAEG